MIIPRSGFIRHTDQTKIREVLDAYMKAPEKQRAPFLVTIFSREHRPGGIVYEGCRPIAASEMEGVRAYSISNGDSNFSITVAFLELSKIEYIEELP